MTTSIYSSKKYLTVPLDTEKGKDNYRQEDFENTLSLIKAHKYSMTKNALTASGDFSFSQIYRFLNTAKYERGFDRYINESKKWSFSFCQTTDEGDNLRITVCPSSSNVKIINVNFLKNSTLNETRKQEKYEVEYDQVLDFISQERFTYSIHANQRMSERNLTISMIKDVVLHGVHEASQDRWNSTKETWGFVFCDIIDGREIRAVVGVEKFSAKIVTVIDVTHKTAPFSDTGIDLPRSKIFKQERSGGFKQDELEKSFDDLLLSRTKRDRGDSSSPLSSTSLETPFADRFQPNFGKPESVSLPGTGHSKKRKSISPSNAQDHEPALSSVVKKKQT